MEILNEYIVILVVALCMGIGYVIKTSLDFIPNKYIPLIMTIIGVSANIINLGEITLAAIVGGLASGLAATGAFEAVRNIKAGVK